MNADPQFSTRQITRWMLTAILTLQPLTGIASVTSELPERSIAVTRVLDEPAHGSIEVIGGETYDWGTVAPGHLTATIEVRNAGGDTLTITEVRPVCGCTTAPIDRSVLLPGEIGRISVEIDMNGRSGPQSKSITVYSNDPQSPAKVIILKADVRSAERTES